MRNVMNATWFLSIWAWMSSDGRGLLRRGLAIGLGGAALMALVMIGGSGLQAASPPCDPVPTQKARATPTPQGTPGPTATPGGTPQPTPTRDPSDPDETPMPGATPTPTPTQDPNGPFDPTPTPTETPTPTATPTDPFPEVTPTPSCEPRREEVLWEDPPINVACLWCRETDSDEGWQWKRFDVLQYIQVYCQDGTPDRFYVGTRSFNQQQSRCIQGYPFSEGCCTDPHSINESIGLCPL
jgi:hypothetical protein